MGYEPSQAPGGGAGGSMAAVSQLFTRLAQEIEEQKPKNCIHFVVDFLCKHYPEHLHGFASIWQMDPDLERERHEVVNFFKAHKISTAVAAHFTNAGYDTLDTLTTLSPDSLVDVEAFNNVKWLPGHKVRLQQIFSEISARVRAYRQQYGENAPRSRHHHSAHHSAHQNAHQSAHHASNHHSSSERRHDSPNEHYRHAPANYHGHEPRHGTERHESYPQRPYSPAPHHAAHHASHAAHAAQVYVPRPSSPTQGDRHVAFAGGFSGGYAGGFAPPAAVAPMSAAPMSAAPMPAAMPVQMSAVHAMPSGGAGSGHTSPVRSSHAAPMLVAGHPPMVTGHTPGMKLQPGLTPSPNMFLANSILPL